MLVRSAAAPLGRRLIAPPRSLSYIHSISNGTRNYSLRSIQPWAGSMTVLPSELQVVPQRLRYNGSARFMSTTDSETAKEADKETPAGESEADSTAETKETTETSPPPSREQELEAQVKNLKDQLLRSLAEQENVRRIAKKDVESARSFSIKSFAKSLLDSADNLERALEAVPEDLRKDTDKHAVLATLYEGIAMTQDGLLKAFESNGLVKFGQVGEKFDPKQHDALFDYADPAKEAGTIGQLMKTGYMLKSRVLRPAEVGVINNDK